MENFTFSLSRQELDVVMKALGELPLKEALPVFNQINEQYIKQIKKEGNDA